MSDARHDLKELRWSIEQLCSDLEDRVISIRQSKITDPDRAEALAYAYDWIARELRERLRQP